MEQEIVETYNDVKSGNMTLEEFAEWLEEREQNASLIGYF